MKKTIATLLARVAGYLFDIACNLDHDAQEEMFADDDRRSVDDLLADAEAVWVKQAEEEN